MLTYEQKYTLCVLHSALALDALFEVSPISRININAEVKCSQSELLNFQLLHAHFQNFISDNFSSYEEGISMSEQVHMKLATDLTYRSRTILRNTIIDCISKLMGPNPKYETELDRFILGYSTYIPSRETKKQIGEWFASKDKTLYYTWHMF